MVKRIGRRAGAGHVEHVDAESIETRELVDAPILVGKHIRSISETFMDTGSMTVTTSGSAATANDTDHYSIASGTSSNSFGKLERWRSGVAVDFDSDFVMRVSWHSNTYGSSAGDQQYITIGLRLSEDTYTSNHIGVGILAGEFVATAGNGSSQTTKVIDSNPPTDSDFIDWLVWDSSEQKVDVYHNREPNGDNQPNVSISSGTPATNTSADLVQVSVDNDGNANNNQVDISEMQIGVGR